MTPDSRINAFAALGNHIKKLTSKPNHYFDEILSRAEQQNPWFTKDNQIAALNAISSMLHPQKLEQWINSYQSFVKKPENARVIGVIMAGNIPAVGFHDMLCVLISGYKIKMKLSKDDFALMEWLSKQLVEIDSGFESQIELCERIDQADAIIATGSDNTSRYFEFYFGKYPHIIRKNRNSVAVLTGEEPNRDLENLGNDIFSYFGLGCRNVSMILVPKGYDLNLVFAALKPFAGMMQHHKYMNNFDYQQAMLLLNNEPILTNNFIILKNSKTVASPVSVLHYMFYDSQDELLSFLHTEREKIQCVVSDAAWIPNAIPPGKAQQPELWDYADGIDTLKFLESL